MATTTNYSWSTPDDTDLVKDGAAAIRTLGTAIDSTVFTNAGAAVAKATVDAKGDLIAGTADNTVARLAVGANGTTLVADSGEATGLAWKVDPVADLVTTAGDTLYATAADTLTRLGIGTAGQILTVNSGATAPEWATPAATGGMTLISTTTLTGASVTLSSIPQTYKDLKIIVRNFKPANDGEVLDMRMNSDSTANRHRDGLAGGGVNTFNTTRFYLGAAQDNSVATGLTEIDIPDYTNTTTWKWMQAIVFNVDSTTTTSVSFNPTWGVYNQTAAITSLDFFPNAGNFTSGTILLYGVK
jgi:hypothetical protein